MALLTASEYSGIRAALDVSLDADMVPDSIIEEPIFGPAAELWVMEQDPLWSTRTGTAQRHLLNALTYYAASLIAPSMPAILSESQGPYAYSRASVDWMKRAAELAGRAEEEIAAVLAPSQSVTRYPTFMTRAPGQRGR